MSVNLRKMTYDDDEPEQHQPDLAQMMAHMQGGGMPDMSQGQNRRGCDSCENCEETNDDTSEPSPEDDSSEDDE